jgi:hypothetical protein
LNITKILIISLALTLQVCAQTTFEGVAATGIESGPELPIQLGVKAWYRADKGVSTQGSNVFAWADLSGNGYNLTQYNTTNQPTFIPAFTTNSMAVVRFDTSTGPKHLFCDALATNFSGEDKPFTVFALIVGQTNGNSCMPMGFGWSSATNANASRKGITINRPGSTTTSGFFLVADTNNSAVAGIAYIQNFTGFTTNRAFIYSTGYDGQNGIIFNNLQAGTNALFDTGPITVNQFTMGLTRATNGTFLGSASGGIWRGEIAEAQWYDYKLTTTQQSNVVNDIRRRMVVPCY